VCRGTPSQSSQVPYSVVSSTTVSPTSNTTASITPMTRQARNGVGMTPILPNEAVAARPTAFAASSLTSRTASSAVGQPSRKRATKARACLAHDGGRAGAVTLAVRPATAGPPPARR
jgi:hypothetical protein